ncbi:hypothetical protein [Flavihumibacter fluvii]|uniref:hypothetical protein n=1 Tax=Flavihumibacter fluvii TaxID=2838157 RepID=UPI001BDE3D7E|nr:hypothetical protein [Flavihumibacter fluvii]ULQ54548.1 hypothetical protein KJS93_09470 [Flavihumibacter fluvii]
MDLNDIPLSDHLITALYAHTLVLTEPGDAKKGPIQPVATDEKKPAGNIQFLGKNNQNFVILVNYPDQLHLPDESFNFLGTVLKACQLNAADIAIVNLAHQDLSLQLILDQLSPKVILAFGTGHTLPGLPVAIQLVPAKTARFQYMQAPGLETLLQGGDAVKPQKKQLWEGLKQMLQL